ncbi:MAG: hypothetical protein QG616_677 [Pseudomonadota bacterium]|nr:hypothetical protein [Pseudomonadota bacterium]
MSTDTPQAESEVSIESRLSAAFAAEETGAPEAAPVEPAPEASEEPTTEVETEEVAEDVFEFEADDGTTLKLPAAVEKAVLRQRDYTQKTMQLAELQKQAHDRLQYAEAREQLSAAVMEDVTQLRSIESQLKQYQEADWPALYEANPGQALRFQQVMRDLEKQITQKQHEINAKVQHVQQATQKHNQFQWEAAEKGARQMIGEISAADNAAMLRTVESLGITPKEFKERFADPRIIAAVHKAAKWDSLQAGKSKAVQTANQAPPVVKPGASKGPSVAAEQKYRDTRAKFSKTGSVQDAAKLFLLRGI